MAETQGIEPSGDRSLASHETITVADSTETPTPTVPPVEAESGGYVTTTSQALTPSDAAIADAAARMIAAHANGDPETVQRVLRGIRERIA